jgi:hypothetical protein
VALAAASVVLWVSEGRKLVVKGLGGGA